MQTEAAVPGGHSNTTNAFPLQKRFSEMASNSRKNSTKHNLPRFTLQTHSQKSESILNLCTEKRFWVQTLDPSLSPVRLSRWYLKSVGSGVLLHSAAMHCAPQAECAWTPPTHGQSTPIAVPLTSLPRGWSCLWEPFLYHKLPPHDKVPLEAKTMEVNCVQLRLFIQIPDPKKIISATVLLPWTSGTGHSG